MPTRAPDDTAYEVTDRNRAGSREERLMPKMVQNRLNEKCSTFPGAFPVRATTGAHGAIGEERAEKRRERVHMAAISPAFPTRAFKKG
ncbi:MAG TPA: hypothetical protein VF748_00760 [Candidatus Acidoferrum sp.]